MNIVLPEQYKALFEPMRFKDFHGGRSGCKSWSFAVAEVLLMSLHNPNNSAEYNQNMAAMMAAEYGVSEKLFATALRRPMRFLNCREIQNSIAESAHKLLKDTIGRMGLDSIFDCPDRSISCKNGSEAYFTGLFRNVDKIKSFEGIDIAVVWEAQPTSDESLEILIPTIRKEEKDSDGNILFQSEIWFEYNPKYEDDPVYKRFVIGKPHNCRSVEINYTDVLDFVPEVMKQEALDCKRVDETTYQNIWMGKPIGAGAKIWHKYDEAVHVRDFKLSDFVDRSNLFMGCDPHSKFWPACVWVALVPKNERNDEFYKVVYDEYPTFDDVGALYSDIRNKLYYTGSLEDLSRAIYSHDHTGQYGKTVRKRFIDTRFAKGAGGGNWGTSTQGIVQEWAKPQNGGILFDMPPEHIIDVQRDAILMDMDYNRLMPIGPFNDPNLVVLPHCKNVRQTLENHRCVEGEEKEDDKYKDFSDALRITWAGMSQYKWSNPSPEKEVEYSPVGESWMA